MHPSNCVFFKNEPLFHSISFEYRWHFSRSCHRMQFKTQKGQLLLSFATLLQLISCPHANPEVDEDSDNYNLHKEPHRHAFNHTFSKSKSKTQLFLACERKTLEVTFFSFFFFFFFFSLVKFSQNIYISLFFAI